MELLGLIHRSLLIRIINSNLNDEKLFGQFCKLSQNLKVSSCSTSPSVDKQKRRFEASGDCIRTLFASSSYRYDGLHSVHIYFCYIRDKFV